MAKNFVSITPTLEDYWRSIILFGRNTASYKFALASSLLHFGSKQNEEIKSQDIASIFSQHICDHLKVNDKQAVSTSNSYLDKCREYNAGDQRDVADRLHIFQAHRMGLVISQHYSG